MTKNPQVPARISRELLEAVKAKLKDNGMSWPFLIKKLLNLYLQGKIEIR